MNMQITQEKKRPLKIGDVSLSWPDFMFILVTNASVIMIIINAILNKTFWCYYPILGLFYIYVIFNSCFGGTAKKFLSRFRTGVFFVNTIFIFTALIHWLFAGSNWPLVAYKWILPIILIISLFVVFGTAFYGTVTLLNLLVATTLMLPQVTGIFIFAVVNHYSSADIYNDFTFVLTVVMFALYLMIIANLAFLHIVKVRNKIDDAMNKNKKQA